MMKSNGTTRMWLNSKNYSYKIVYTSTGCTFTRYNSNNEKYEMKIKRPVGNWVVSFESWIDVDDLWTKFKMSSPDKVYQDYVDSKHLQLKLDL